MDSGAQSRPSFIAEEALARHYREHHHEEGRVKGGDISNQVPACLMIVFEGLLGIEKNPAKERAMCRLHRWDAAVRCWEINELLVAQMWKIQYRYDWAMEVVTYKGEGFANALEKRLERLPIRAVSYSTPNDMAHFLPPYVTTIYDADRTRRFHYGGRGVYVDDLAKFSLY